MGELGFVSCGVAIVLMVIESRATTFETVALQTETQNASVVPVGGDAEAVLDKVAEVPSGTVPEIV